ncbi:MAG: type II toxin-antitoxin system ParD family antitoxin [Thiolinea sp.]
MIRHTISIPDPMSNYISHQVKSGQYGNVSEYIRDLVRKDQEQKKLAMAELRSMLDKAEEGGISNLSMDDIRTRARKRAGL